MIQAKPFLKWAGGKRQLLNDIENILPPEIKKNEEIDLYIEPFVGGGALLFHLLSNYSVKESIINDINPDLILSYKVIKQYPEELIKKLREIENEYLSLSYEERKEYFYHNLRTKFNELKINYSKLDTKSSVEKVALLIALNKTCFNGLYRQNSRGEFNVPVGRYKNPKILDEENLRNVSTLLKNTKIVYGSYDSINIPTKTNALIYFDPPYRPLTTSGFTKYSKEDFNDKDQKQLAKYFRRLSKDKHYLLLSNSDTKDGFFDELYKGFNIKRVSAKRSINSKANGRGNINELLIINY
ncbi:MAG: DNA adenine methylase [Candidatus Dojkabacteria bacterium]|jgi:DNA adenine methylase|nr:DNA adenine methylase [Candidatus Dojkabacteria bacterium]